MNARDELAKRIFTADNWDLPADEMETDWAALVKQLGRNTYAHRIAGGLIAEGYVKLHQVTTVEELHALPEGETIVDANGRPLRAKTGTKGIRGWKHLDPADAMEAGFLMDAVSVHLPAVVLPGADQ